MFTIFVVSTKKITSMKRPTKKQKEYEAELIYYLRRFNDLNGREGVTQVLSAIEQEIDRLIEILKEL